MHRFGVTAVPMLLLLALVSQGCLAGPEDIERSRSGVLPKKTKMNGGLLNSGRLIGQNRLDGALLRGWSGARRVSRVDLTGDGRFELHMENGSRLSDQDMVDATFGNESVTFKVKAVSTTTRLFSYSIDVKVGSSWTPACDDAENVSVLNGWWDNVTGRPIDPSQLPPAAFTLGCEGNALGKCAALGYENWDPQGRDLHASCVRMIRADYCGVGSPNTVPGPTIDVWDVYGINANDPQWVAPLEGEFGPNGAVCVALDRLPAVLPNTSTLEQYLDWACPDVLEASRSLAAQGRPCGSGFTAGFVMNESNRLPVY